LWGAFTASAGFVNTVERLIKIDHVASGAYVDSDELREAQEEAEHIRRWRKLTEAVESLTFTARPARR
jgi:hypothetical protein